MAKGSEKNLDELTVAELRVRASKLEITGRSAMNKAELRQAVEDAEEQLASLKNGGSNGAAKQAGKAGATSGAQAKSKANGDAKAKGKRKSGGDTNGKAKSGPQDASDTPAPSIGPNTTIEKESAEERLAKHEQSDVDAMGLDKRRGVAGGSYGPSFAKQATLYGIALAVIVALFVGGKIAVDELDQGPAVNPDEAPWSAPVAEQRPPAPLDFPRNPSP